MNLGRSEYYKLKEKEKDLEILLSKFKYAADSWDKFDWGVHPYMMIALEFKDAKFLSDMIKKYQPDTKSNEKINRDKEEA